jgi:protein-disulfide isomerase
VQSTALAGKLPADARAPSRGPVDAPVVLQVFSDFECPFCADLVPTLDALEAEYRGKIRIVWRNLPLPMHPHARLAASAGLEAHAQRGNAGFWQMHDLIWRGGQPNRAALLGYARTLKLDSQRFARALDERWHDAAIDRDVALADAHAIPATPTCVINGRAVVGSQPIDEFRRVISIALQQQGGPAAAPPQQN